ncbi:MAG: outer membrane lipoprotein-sorting protein [Pseudomonadales bacterium]|nr:outer membrane lipoprotein-sorting protein [Pseudomonadales bacterium]
MLSFFALPVYSDSSVEKGRAIFEEMDVRESGFGDFSTKQTMILRSKSGQESRRQMENYVLEGIGSAGDKTLVIFRSPKRVRGTALLTHSQQAKDDDQWLYLPILGRVKRISGASKAGAFLGSEFSYEDLAPLELDDYDYRFLGEEKVDGVAFYKIERIPRNVDSGYSRQVVWVHQQYYRFEKVVFYDRKETLLKEVVFKDYKRYLDKYWRPHTINMVNKSDGKSTDLLIEEYKFRTGLNEESFTQASLRRIK